MARKRQKIDINEIILKKPKLENKIKELASKKRKNETRELLDAISDIIEKYLREGVSYRNISKAIYETYSIRIHETTLRSYAQNVLGIPPRKKKKDKKEEYPELEY